MRVDSKITIGYDEFSERQWNKLFRQLTFVTPNQDVVECYRRIYTRNRIHIPRGAWNLVDDLDYVDKRSLPEAPALKFDVVLDDLEKDPRFIGQKAAVAAMFKHEQGQIIRPPGTGKTQIALAFIAACKTTSLVLVHTEDILNQWLEYAREAIPDIEIGVVRGQRLEVGHLTIAMIQTIRNMVELQDKGWWRQFGCVIADEAHHAAAPSWDSVMNWTPGFYRFGFTASATRADGLHPAIKFIIGPVIHKQKFSSSVKLTVEPIKSNFYFVYRCRFDWVPMVTKLTQDEKRNRQIAEVADAESREGNSTLILSRRIEHLERIASYMREPCEILTGQRNSSDRKRILSDFRAGKVLVVLATQLADEALDVPRLNRIVLAHPGKHEGRLIQQIGRAIREHPSKHDAVIYDVYDGRVGVLKNQWRKRKQAY